MKVGMLWFDDDAGRTLAEKVARAATHYAHKYGRAPTACYVHPSALDGAGCLRPAQPGEQQVDGVAVRSARTVQPNRLWIGVEEP